MLVKGSQISWYFESVTYVCDIALLVHSPVFDRTRTIRSMIQSHIIWIIYYDYEELKNVATGMESKECFYKYVCDNFADSLRGSRNLYGW